MLALIAVGSVSACRRARLSHGDGASVVVVAPRSDAAPARRLAEREPNDSPEQAQLLVLNAEWPVIDVEGSLSSQSDPTASRDVDVFKLQIPGSAGGHDRSPSRDSAQPEDPRWTARRLILDIAPESGASVTLQILDDDLKVLEAVTAENGEPAGMPNMAAQPGRFYYFRVKAFSKSGKSAEPPVPCRYKLSVQLSDFEVADEREPNDSMEAAETTVMGGMAELAGLYGWQHDQDFYRLPAPEVASALDVVLDGVEGVTPGLQVLAGGGSRLAISKGRKGEKLSLHNVRIGAGAVDAGADSRFFYVMVRSEAGQNRGQRYVLHLSLGAFMQDAEIEPNDAPANATPVHDGTTLGFLPAGDVDYFLYDSGEPREISVEVSFPGHLRGKVEVSRARKAGIVVSAETKKPHQQVELSRIANLGEPLLLRIAPVKGDGNANEPYTVRISSAPPSGDGQIPQIRLPP